MMSEHTFTLILDGPVDDRLEDLFEAGCDDATFGKVDGVAYADFDRDARTFAEAVLSALQAVESVRGLRVLRVEPDDLVTQAEIAERLGRSRESVRLLVTGQRGSGGFPAPVSHARARARLWRWSDVAGWAWPDRQDELASARLIAALNARLEARALEPTLGDHQRHELARVLG